MQQRGKDAEDSAPPPDYQGKWMTRKELRQRNRELKPLGKRICTTHQGAALPLDEAHFYYYDRAKGEFRGDCRRCCCERVTARTRVRRADPLTQAQFYEYERQRQQRYRASHPEKVRRANQRRKQRRNRAVAAIFGISA